MSLPSFIMTIDDSSTTSLTTIVTSSSGQLTMYTKSMLTSFAIYDSVRVTTGPSLPASPPPLVSLPPLLSVLPSSTNAPRNGVFGSWRPSSTSGGKEKVLVLDDEFEDTTQQRYVDPSNPLVSVPCSMSPPSLCPSSFQITTSHRLFVVNRGACSAKIWLPPREASGHRGGSVQGFHTLASPTWSCAVQKVRSAKQGLVYFFFFSGRTLHTHSYISNYFGLCSRALNISMVSTGGRYIVIQKNFRFRRSCTDTSLQ